MKTFLFILLFTGFCLAQDSTTIAKIDEKLRIIELQIKQLEINYERLIGARGVLIELRKELKEENKK